MGSQRPIVVPNFEVLGICLISSLADKKTKAQRGDVTFSTPHGQLVTKRSELKLPMVQADVHRQGNFHFL